MKDEDFDEYLNRESELSQLYHAGATDRAPESAVLKIVGRAKEPLPRSENNGWTRRAWRWLFPNGDSLEFGRTRLIPASAAAVLVVVLVIGVRTENGIEPQPTIPADLSPASDVEPNSHQPILRPEVTTKIPPVALPTPTPAEAGVDQSAPGKPISVANPRPRTTEENTLPPPSAEAWLASIDKLLEEGLQEEARVAFYAFREQYPNSPLPEGLLQRLGM